MVASTGPLKDQEPNTKKLVYVLNGQRAKQFDVLVNMDHLGRLSPRHAVVVRSVRKATEPLKVFAASQGVQSASPHRTAEEHRQAQYLLQLSNTYTKDPKAVLEQLHPLYEAMASRRRVGFLVKSQKDLWKFHGFQSFWTLLHDVVRDTRPL